MELISREAAIEALKGLPTWWADSGGYYGGAQPPMEALLEPNDAISAIENLPSAQPETAKRIVGKSRDGMTLWYQCDMCNEPVDAQDNFCRGCGRRLTDG